MAVSKRAVADAARLHAALARALQQQQGVWQRAGKRLLPGGWGHKAPAAGGAAAAQPAAGEPKSKAKPASSGAGSAAPVASHAAAGAALFGCLLFLAGAFPWALPHAFLLFVATALPWRVYYYTRVQPWNCMFLLDFCYAVTAATTVFLCLPAAARGPRLEAAVYALADGPVSAALVAWQCSWVFHSPDHTVSVLVHLLPGLAMAAHHHLPRTSLSWGHPGGQASQLGTYSCLGDAAAAAATHAGEPALAGLGQQALWLLAAPLAFYLVWQAAYFVVVQVLARQYICREKLDTSYRCLCRRAARANNIWARIVLRGSTGRRLLMYGLLQLAFTVASLLLWLPTYHSFRLAFAWQTIKVMVPVYYGCKYTCERMYRAAMAEGVRQYKLEVDARTATTAAADMVQAAPQMSPLVAEAPLPAAPAAQERMLVGTVAA